MSSVHQHRIVVCPRRVVARNKKKILNARVVVLIASETMSSNIAYRLNDRSIDSNCYQALCTHNHHQETRVTDRTNLGLVFIIVHSPSTFLILVFDLVLKLHV